MVEQDVV